MRKYVKDRYIVHPIRVMETCREFTNDMSILAAAILHDVLEDTPVTRDELGQFLLSVMAPDAAHRTLLFVIELTDVFVKKDYPRMNRTLRKENERKRLSNISSEAQTIKYADIFDNASDIFLNDPDFAPRFLKEGKLAIEQMTQGNQILRDRVLISLHEHLAKTEAKKNP